MNPRSIIVIAIVALVGGIAFDYFASSPGAPTNVITKERVHMASPPSALEAPVMDGMAGAGKPATTNTPVVAPTFADGVLIATAVMRSNPGFATLLTQQEQVALCARVWQQQRGNAK